jgi:hypothetical protein
MVQSRNEESLTQGPIPIFIKEVEFCLKGEFCKLMHRFLQKKGEFNALY